jgi:hypothetical protein
MPDAEDTADAEGDQVPRSERPAQPVRFAGRVANERGERLGAQQR